MKKKVVVKFAFWIILTSVSSSYSQTSNAESPLGLTVKEFLETWLVKRNTKKALDFVSENAIVGTCIIPEKLKNKTLSRRHILGIFREMLKLEGLTRVSRLEDVATSEGADLLSAHKLSLAPDLAPFFHIYRIAEDTKRTEAFVCKFDESKAFRDRSGRPDVRYVVTRLLSKDGPSVIFTTLWIQEEGKWHILTMEIGSDED